MSPQDMRQVAVAVLHAENDMKDSQHWNSLTGGGWSLVDQFDRDGRRYLIAERAMGCVPISAPDWRMLAARARGAALKVIACELGVSVPAVSRRVRRAMDKLGIRSQGELARLLGPGFESG